MATEPERYLRKARESLASAQADVRGKRYNSAANRAYYAVFQAAVSALIHFRIRKADSEWQHRFVGEEFSGKLIKRRKLLGRQFSPTLNKLFGFRIKADYSDVDVSHTEATVSTLDARAFVDETEKAITRKAIGETRAEYGSGMTQTKTALPTKYVTQVKRRILHEFPALQIETHKRGPRDFTLDVYGITNDIYERFSEVYELTTDILVYHDVWIVVVPLPERDN